MTTSTPDVTRLLVAWGDGETAALNQLMPLVYEELRRLAHQYVIRERPGHTLQTSALVNEAYLRLIDQKDVRWQNRAHFFAISAQAMRRILIDSARRHTADKRGGKAEKVSLDEVALVCVNPDSNLLALDEALNRLAQIDSQQSRIVELRYFGGLTIEETGQVMNLSPATVKREWAMARAWLYEAIAGGAPEARPQSDRVIPDK